MAEEINAEIVYEEYTGPEEPFIPPEKLIEFKLVPAPEEEEPELFPPKIEYEPVKHVEPIKKTLIIDIETTGADPTKSRLVCIGVKDPNFPEAEPTVFFNDNLENEEKTVREFISWFEENGFTEIAGYNVDFDYRFIMALLLKYRIVSPTWFKTDIFDLMSFLQKGKNKYVPTHNKLNKLEEWVEYLFGKTKMMSYKELMIAIRNKEWDKIKAYNKLDVELTFLIWSLIMYSSNYEIE